MKTKNQTVKIKNSLNYKLTAKLLMALVAIGICSQSAFAQSCYTTTYHPGLTTLCACDSDVNACLPAYQVNKRGYTTCDSGSDYANCPTISDTVGTENHCDRTINVDGIQDCLSFMGLLTTAWDGTWEGILTLLGDILPPGGPCTFCHMTSCSPSSTPTNIDRSNLSDPNNAPNGTCGG